MSAEDHDICNEKGCGEPGDNGKISSIFRKLRLGIAHHYIWNKWKVVKITARDKSLFLGYFPIQMSALPYWQSFINKTFVNLRWVLHLQILLWLKEEIKPIRLSTFDTASQIIISFENLTSALHQLSHWIISCSADLILDLFLTIR